MDNCEKPGMIGDICRENAGFCPLKSQLNDMLKFEPGAKREQLNTLLGAINDSQWEGCLCLTDIIKRAKQALASLDKS